MNKESYSYDFDENNLEIDSKSKISFEKINFNSISENNSDELIISDYTLESWENYFDNFIIKSFDEEYSSFNIENDDRQSKIF